MTSAAQPRPARSRSSARQEEAWQTRGPEADQAYGQAAGNAARTPRTRTASSRAALSRAASPYAAPSRIRSEHGAVRAAMPMRGSASPKPRPERRPDTHADTRRGAKQTSRPALRVIEGEADASKHRIHSPIAWTHTLSKSMLLVGGAIVFLVLSMALSLFLRTLMIEDSFTLSQTQQSISQLQQDVEADELQLEQLNADLPNKATQLGMVPGSGSVTLDMGQGSADSQASHDATDSSGLAGSTSASADSSSADSSSSASAASDSASVSATAEGQAQ